MAVSSTIRIEQGKKLRLAGGCFRIAGRNDIEEAFLLQAAQKAGIPLAADKQICSKEIRIFNAQME